MFSGAAIPSVSLGTLNFANSLFCLENKGIKKNPKAVPRNRALTTYMGFESHDPEIVLKAIGKFKIPQ